jgi:hypothetical protein
LVFTFPFLGFGFDVVRERSVLVTANVPVSSDVFYNSSTSILPGILNSALALSRSEWRVSGDFDGERFREFGDHNFVSAVLPIMLSDDDSSINIVVMETSAIIPKIFY